VEYLSTLIGGVQKRAKPLSEVFSVTGVSSVLAASTKREQISNEKAASIAIQFPQGEEKDWTTDLPELLPDIARYQKGKLTKQAYNPMKEPRSILHRSRRPNAILDYKMKKKKIFEEDGLIYLLAEK
jgi:hypothetical protein